MSYQDLPGKAVPCKKIALTAWGLTVQTIDSGVEVATEVAVGTEEAMIWLMSEIRTDTDNVHERSDKRKTEKTTLTTHGGEESEEVKQQEKYRWLFGWREKSSLPFSALLGLELPSPPFPLPALPSLLLFVLPPPCSSLLYLQTHAFNPPFQPVPSSHTDSSAFLFPLLICHNIPTRNNHECHPRAIPLVQSLPTKQQMGG